MASAGCSAKLAELAAGASVYPPQPVFWERATCSGTAYPDTNKTLPLPKSQPGVKRPDYFNANINWAVVAPFELSLQSKRKIEPFEVNAFFQGSRLVPGNPATPPTNMDPYYKDTPVTSWYTPPGYRVLFFRFNPADFANVGLALQCGYYLSEPGDIVENSLLEKPTYQIVATPPANATPPYSFVTPISTNPEVAVSQYVFLVIQKLRDFSDMVVGMCARSEPISIVGNLLNRTWIPKTQSCDQWMRYLCQTSESRTRYKDVCACFWQQNLLDHRYSPNQYPACCFQLGSDDLVALGDSRACYGNREAYVTQDISDGCCTTQKCESIIQNNGHLIQVQEDAGYVKCAGTELKVPVEPVVDPVTGEVTYTLVQRRSEIPLWVWILTIIFGSLLLLYLIMLVFVSPRSSKFSANEDGDSEPFVNEKEQDAMNLLPGDE